MVADGPQGPHRWWHEEAPLNCFKGMWDWDDDAPINILTYEANRARFSCPGFLKYHHGKSPRSTPEAGRYEACPLPPMAAGISGVLGGVNRRCPQRLASFPKLRHYPNSPSLRAPLLGGR